MARTCDQLTEADLRLVLADGIGPRIHSRLIEHFGSADAAAGASANELCAIKGVGMESARALRRAIDETDPESERALMAERDVRLIIRGDEDYPPLLAAIPDPPPALWVRGAIKPEDRLALAIVGSRRCTSYGREQAGRFASLLAECGLTIVSGGAVGIDGEAHRGALRACGRTIVVMGCGLSRTYPPQHESLFERVVAEGGALISEYPMEMAPLQENFPRRNRVISGMALGVLVVEAARRSGALITARKAAEEHGREVMAIPGRVDSPASAGCLGAIREGWAALVRDHADVLEQLDSASVLVRGALEQAGHADARRQASLFDGRLTESQRAIVDALSDGDSAMLPDQLAARTQIPMHQLMADLTLLQVRGRVDRDHRGVWIKRGST